MRLWLPPLAAALLGFATAPAETAELPANALFGALAAAEIAGVRIGWRHDLRATLEAASQDGLPLVIATEGDGGAWFANVLRCPTFNSLSGQAHFILIKLPLADDASDAARLVNALHMDPAFSSSIAVLRPGGNPFTEILRARGYLDEASLLAKLAEAGLSPHEPSPLERVAVGDEPPHDCLK
jgi:hypothetical protein